MYRIHDLKETHQADKILKTLYWNVNGIGNKFDDKMLIKRITEYDIIVLAETQKGTSYESRAKVSWTFWIHP